MGRRPWATPEQTKFLQDYLPHLEKEKGDCTLTDVYAKVAAKFIEKWPSPLPLGDEFKDYTPDQLKAEADIFRGRVSFHVRFFNLR